MLLKNNTYLNTSELENTFWKEMKTETGDVQIKQNYKNVFDDGFNILKWLKPQITDFA